jgi:hypothetical protein
MTSTTKSHWLGEMGELSGDKVDLPPLSPGCLLEGRWSGPFFSLSFSLFLNYRPPAPP